MKDPGNEVGVNFSRLEDMIPDLCTNPCKGIAIWLEMHEVRRLENRITIIWKAVYISTALQYLCNVFKIYPILQYQEDSDVESLVNKLLAILDKPEKALLLRDVRYESTMPGRKFLAAFYNDDGICNSDAKDILHVQHAFKYISSNKLFETAS